MSKINYRGRETERERGIAHKSEKRKEEWEKMMMLKMKKKKKN